MKGLKGAAGFPPFFYAFHPFYAKDGETSILESLGEAEEDEPKHALHSVADGQRHLGERDDVARDAEREDDDARAEGEAREKSLDMFFHSRTNLFATDLFADEFFHVSLKLLRFHGGIETLRHFDVVKSHFISVVCDLYIRSFCVILSLTPQRYVII